MPDVETRSTYRADIDGLRAIAVLLVLVFHAFPDVLPGGFTGVDVFFVISGYLISGLILDELDSRNFSFRRFYGRRIRRIFPALALVLAACTAFGLVVLLPGELAQLGKHVAAGSAFFSNFALFGELGYFDQAAETKPLLHLWSLGVEEQFYLAWPLALVGIDRIARRSRRPLVLSVTAAVLAASFVLNILAFRTGYLDDRAGAFYLPQARFWELMMGAFLVAATSRSRAPRRYSDSMGVFGLLLIAVGAAAIDRGADFPGWLAVIPTLGTLLLILAGPGGLVNRKLLSRPALVGIGLISYPLYLWHWPLLSFARVLWSEMPPAAVRAAALVASVGLAWVTYRCVERPLRFEMSPRKAVKGLSAALAALGLGGFAIHALGGLPGRLPVEVREISAFDYRAPAEARENYCCYARDSRAAEALHPDCLRPRGAGQKPTVLIWGDSHAAFLARGLYDVLGDAYAVGQHTRNVCPPVLRQGVPQPCIDSNQLVFDRLRESRPESLIIFAAWNMYSQAWDPQGAMAQELLRGLRELGRMGISKILLLGPPPQWKDSLPKQLVRFWRADVSHRIPERMEFGLLRDSAEVDQALRRLELAPTATYVSLRELLCDGDGCLTRYGPKSTDLMAGDYGHFTAGAADLIVRRLPLGSHPVNLH